MQSVCTKWQYVNMLSLAGSIKSAYMKIEMCSNLIYEKMVPMTHPECNADY